MTTTQIIQQMEKELYEFIASSPPNYPSVWKSLIRSRLRTLLESFGEEIIALFALPPIKDKELEQALKNMPGVEQVIRLKVKEILEVIK